MPGRSLPPLPLNKLSAIIGRVCLTNATLSLSLSLFFPFFLYHPLPRSGEATLREKPSKWSGIDSIFRILTFVCRPGIFLFLLRERNYFFWEGGKKKSRRKIGD